MGIIGRKEQVAGKKFLLKKSADLEGGIAPHRKGSILFSPRSHEEHEGKACCKTVLRDFVVSIFYLMSSLFNCRGNIGHAETAEP